MEVESYTGAKTEDSISQPLGKVQGSGDRVP